jgi:hypothetical protein
VVRRKHFFGHVHSNNSKKPRKLIGGALLRYLKESGWLRVIAGIVMLFGGSIAFAVALDLHSRNILRGSDLVVALAVSAAVASRGIWLVVTYL